MTGVIEGCPAVCLSDDLKHELAIHHIRTNLIMAIKRGPNQYENVYDFQTIFYHERDFGIPC